MKNEAETYRVVSGYDNINRSQWSDFVSRHSDGTIFQTPEYYEIHLNAKGFRPHAIAAYDSENNIAGIMVAVISHVYGGVLNYLTSRAVIAGGPLVRNNDAEIALRLLQAFRADKKIKVIYSQFRNLFDVGNLKPAFEKAGAKYEDHLNIHIDVLQSEDGLWKGVKSRKRNQIRQAQRKGLTVSEMVSDEAVKKTYPILEEVYSHAKLPLADNSLFSNAYRLMNPKKMLRIYGVFQGEELVGTMYIFFFNGRFYDWYAGSFRQHYSSYPNDILPWEIFRNAQAEGMTLFDFGGAGKPGVAYGVRDYKMQFGGELVNFGRYELAHNRCIFALAQQGFKIWQKIRK